MTDDTKKKPDAPAAAPEEMKEYREIVERFLSATLDLIQMQGRTPAKALDVSGKGTGTTEPQISGSVELNSQSFGGSLVLHFPEKTFLSLMSRMGVKATQVTPELADGVAEFANIVVGQAKAELNQIGYGFKMGLPKVEGPEGPDPTKTPPENWQVPFESEAGPFTMEVRFYGRPKK